MSAGCLCHSRKGGYAQPGLSVVQVRTRSQPASSARWGFEVVKGYRLEVVYFSDEFC
jgi:hypothetical protein